MSHKPSHKSIDKGTSVPSSDMEFYITYTKPFTEILTNTNSQPQNVQNLNHMLSAEEKAYAAKISTIIKKSIQPLPRQK